MTWLHLGFFFLGLLWGVASGFYVAKWDYLGKLKKLADKQDAVNIKHLKVVQAQVTEHEMIRQAVSMGVMPENQRYVQ